MNRQPSTMDCDGGNKPSQPGRQGKQAGTQSAVLATTPHTRATSMPSVVQERGTQLQWVCYHVWHSGTVTSVITVSLGGICQEVAACLQETQRLGANSLLCWNQMVSIDCLVTQAGGGGQQPCRAGWDAGQTGRQHQDKLEAGYIPGLVVSTATV